MYARRLVLLGPAALLAACVAPPPGDGGLDDDGATGIDGGRDAGAPFGSGDAGNPADAGCVGECPPLPGDAGFRSDAGFVLDAGPAMLPDAGPPPDAGACGTVALLDDEFESSYLDGRCSLGHSDHIQGGEAVVDGALTFTMGEAFGGWAVGGVERSMAAYDLAGSALTLQVDALPDPSSAARALFRVVCAAGAVEMGDVAGALVARTIVDGGASVVATAPLPTALPQHWRIADGDGGFLLSSSTDGAAFAPLAFVARPGSTDARVELEARPGDGGTDFISFGRIDGDGDATAFCPADLEETFDGDELGARWERQVSDGCAVEVADGALVARCDGTSGVAQAVERAAHDYRRHVVDVAVRVPDNGAVAVGARSNDVPGLHVYVASDAVHVAVDNWHLVYGVGGRPLAAQPGDLVTVRLVVRDDRVVVVVLDVDGPHVVADVLDVPGLASGRLVVGSDTVLLGPGTPAAGARIEGVTTTYAP